MGNPAAFDGTHLPTAGLQTRLVEAYRRYERAHEVARHGTLSEVELVRARMDLTLLLQAVGEALPDEVLTQLSRDADKLVNVSAPLPGG